MAHSETFPDDLDGSDFNDVATTLGADAVASVVNAAIAAGTGGVSEIFPALPDEGSGTNKPDTWPDLVPLEDEGTTARPAPFPFHGLGALLGCAADAIAKDVQAPDAIAGGSVLAAASLVVQPLADVMLPYGQRSPLSEFFATSGDSGDRKSAVDAVACAAINEYRQEQAREHHRAMQRYQQERAQFKKGDEEPVEPMPTAVTVGNATIEGVMRLLRGQSSIGIFSPDGGDVLGGHSMKDTNRMASMAFFLKAWSAESLDVMRGGAGMSSLLGRRIAMHVMVQPVLLKHLLSDPLASGQGFLARCLIAQPDTLAGTRLFTGARATDNPDVQAYNARVAELLTMRPTVWPNGDGFELKPSTIGLSDSARALWIEFYNEVERQQAHGGELEQARAFASKAGEHVARIAGIITMFSDPSAHMIDVDTLAGAVEVMNFYLFEHVRLTGAGKAHQRNQQLLALLEWMQGMGAWVATADVLQKTPRAIRKLKAAGTRGLLDELHQRGYIRPAGHGWEVRADA